MVWINVTEVVTMMVMMVMKVMKVRGSVRAKAMKSNSKAHQLVR